MSASLAAQTLSVPDNLVEGSAVSIAYSDAARAGQTITVTVTDGRLFPVTETITITLDENGDGAAGWTVPGWSEARFSAPNVSNVEREIELPAT